MHARIHEDDKAQDIRNMGGLRRWLPLTHVTFAAATAAIIGLPLTSGFFSKDEILYRAFVNYTINPATQYRPPTWIGPVLYVVGVLAAAMTAFYMCRVYFLTFWGDFRGWTVGRPSLLARLEVVETAHSPEVAGPDAHGHDHPHDDLARPGYAPTSRPGK